MASTTASRTAVAPNLLVWNTEEVTEAPTSWDVIWEQGADYAGDISIYDSSIFIADAALHLMATQPDLGIENPYQLNQEQFDAAIALLEELDANDPLYWGAAADQIASFDSGDVVVGTTWQYQVNSCTERRRSRRPCRMRAPPAGQTPG